jgi:ClpP class serine protease
MLYLIEPQALQTLRESAHLAPTLAERMAFERDHTATSRSAPHVAGDVATIDIDGVLTPKPDPFAKFFGGGNTDYGTIRAALRAAKADPSVRHARLNISSPGGTVAGLFETLDEIDAFKASGKSMSVVSNFACSAAYAIAAAAGPIDAAGEHASFGSVGVAASFFVSDKVVDIASTEAPHKRPDLRTAAGRAIVQKELDDLHTLFVKRIARGRKLPENANFGKGAVVLASEALTMKMIDSIGSGAKGGAASASAGGTMRRALELKALMMGDDEAVAELFVQRMQGASSSTPQATTMRYEEKAARVADLMYGPEQAKGKGVVVTWHDGSRDHL